MSINSQMTATTVIRDGNGRTIALPDPAAYYPAAVKDALDTYLDAAKRAWATSADPQEASELEAECVRTWEGFLAALAEHEGRTRTRAATGRREAAKRLRQLVDEIEDAAADYVACSLIEEHPRRTEFPADWRSRVPGFLELNLGLDGNGDVGGIRQALEHLHGA